MGRGAREPGVGNGGGARSPRRINRGPDASYYTPGQRGIDRGVVLVFHMTAAVVSVAQPPRPPTWNRVTEVAPVVQEIRALPVMALALPRWRVGPSKDKVRLSATEREGFVVNRGKCLRGQ